MTRIEIMNKTVPFVSEVEKFNKILNKPNDYSPIIPNDKNPLTL